MPIVLFGRIGIYSLTLFFLYLLAQYMIFHFQADNRSDTRNHEVVRSPGDLVPLKKAVGFFVLAMLITAGAGTWLAFIGEQISETTGLSTSFVGTLFLAFCTSASEIVVSISAVRLGALDMAVGNMVGSNLFNMGVIIFVDDLFYSAGPILKGVNIDHLITALFAVLMSSIVIIGIIFRPRFRWRIPVGVDTAALVILYVGAMVTLYVLSKSA
ncbi:MAG: hypothetical protein Q7J73_02530 [Dehalococcoidales bacterium]|nr:hypothetical protein [Dehalococcoidales bacterium]